MHRGGVGVNSAMEEDEDCNCDEFGLVDNGKTRNGLKVNKWYATQLLYEPRRVWLGRILFDPTR